MEKVQMAGVLLNLLRHRERGHGAICGPGIPPG
jgi:hypothetical protein